MFYECVLFRLMVPTHKTNNPAVNGDMGNAMFLNTENNRSLWFGAYRLFELIFHNTVRSVRQGHRDAVFAILSSVLQTLVMVGVFYLFMNIMGMRALAIRGDFVLYIMSGIFLFMTHIKVLSAIVSSEGPASPMMQHLPMTTTVAIASAALSSLYIQTLSMLLILYVYHIGWGPVTIWSASPRAAAT